MTLRILGVCATLLLAGCADLPSLNSLFTYDRDEDVQAPADPVMTGMSAPVPIPAPADDWCKTSGVTARNRAAADGFDTATQDRLALQVARQCAALNAQN